MHGLNFARDGCRPHSTSVHGIQFLDSFNLSLSSCSRKCTLCKGGVMIRLLVFWGLDHSIFFFLQRIASWELYYECLILSFFNPIHCHPLCGGGQCISLIVM